MTPRAVVDRARELAYLTGEFIDQLLDGSPENFRFAGIELNVVSEILDSLAALERELRQPRD